MDKWGLAHVELWTLIIAVTTGVQSSHCASRRQQNPMASWDQHGREMHPLLGCVPLNRPYHLGSSPQISVQSSSIIHNVTQILNIKIWVHREPWEPFAFSEYDLLISTMSFPKHQHILFSKNALEVCCGDHSTYFTSSKLVTITARFFEWASGQLFIQGLRYATYCVHVLEVHSWVWNGS